MQNIDSAEANADVPINENFESVGPASLYGRRAPATTGLTWAYWGGQFNGNTIANGTVALTASNTNYVVAARSDGAVTASTSNTNWNDATNYVRLQSIVAGASTITSYIDFRQPYGFSPPGAGDGDVVGPASSVDNTLPRFNGTGGKTIQASGVVISDADEVSGYKGNINTQTGTSYTLLASDSGKLIELGNAGDITLTLPNSLAKGFCCTVVQTGAGQVSFSPASGATLRNRQSHTKTFGQWAETMLYVRANTGTDAEYVLGGDTAP